MIKYNYKSASELWDKYYDLACDPWTFGDVEKQQERRYFMRAVTRCEDIKLYTDYIQMLIEEARPVEDAKSRCFDFKYERELEELKQSIILFSHSIERYSEV